MQRSLVFLSLYIIMAARLFGTLSNIINQQAKAVRIIIKAKVEINLVQFVNLILESKLWLGDRFRKA